MKTSGKILCVVAGLLVLGVVVGGNGSENSTTGTVVTQSGTQTENEAIAVMEEKVIYEGHDVVIKTMGCEDRGSSFDVKLYIENNSTFNFSFDAHSYAVNGIMVSNHFDNMIGGMRCDVAAGKKANTTLSITRSVLNQYGIGAVRNLDLLIWVYDNDVSYKSFETEQLHLSTSFDDDTHDQFVGEPVYEEKGITITYLGKDNHEYAFTVRNDTGNNLSFDAENVTINNYTMDNMNLDFIRFDLLNNCETVLNISVDSDFYEMNQIDVIEQIEFTITVRPNDQYEGKWNTGVVIVKCA